MFLTCARQIRSVPRTPEIIRRAPVRPANQSWQHLATSVRLSQPGDADEVEADRVADSIMRGDSAGSVGAKSDGIVQRKCAGCASGATLCPECEEEEGRIQRQTSHGATPALSWPVSGGDLGSGQPLDSKVRAEFEPRYGCDFSAVRVHRDPAAAASAQALAAKAYTHGTDIVFGSGQYDPASGPGKRLLAHELTHVIQQSRSGSSVVQRDSKGLFDIPIFDKFDVCVDVPDIGKVCGSDAAKVCEKLPDLPGCGTVCRIFGCEKPKKPSAKCPPGWRAAGSKDFQGQCCKGSIDNAQNCCPPDRIALLDDRCCKEGEVVSDNRCKKAGSPAPPTDFCPPSRRTLLGECCHLPLVPRGIRCVLPDEPAPPQPKPPQPVLPTATQIFFEFDRPHAGEGGGALSSATTEEGFRNFKALAENLKNNPKLKVQLVGRASSEGSDEYNLQLGERRSRMVADALKAAGVAEAQFADPPEADLAAGCQLLGNGLATCGELNATGPRDRQVLARTFESSAP